MILSYLFKFTLFTGVVNFTDVVKVGVIKEVYEH
jgi:hypothetical protein